MRLLHLDTEKTWRGGENQLRLLLTGLRRDAATLPVENHVAVPPGSVAEERLAALATVTAVPMRGGFSPGAIRRLVALVDRHQIDLIDAHTSNAHALALAVKSFRPRLGLVVHRRVDYPPGKSWFNRKKYLSKSVDRYVAISEAIREVLTAWGVPADRITVVRSAVDLSGYARLDRADCKAALAKAYGIDPGLVFLGNASAMTSQKGYETLLDALAVLKRSGVPFHAFVAGDGELRTALERQRIALGLEHDLTFLGWIDDVPSFISGLDVLAMPSNFEGLGTLLLEAAGARTPIAATRVGGIPEVVIDGRTGLLSPVGDAGAFAAALTRLIGDAGLRSRLGAAVHDHVHSTFSVDAMVKGNLAVYREVLQGRG